MKLLACPKCHQQLHLENKTLKCENNHCYDISKRGYINLLLNPDKARDEYPKHIYNRISYFLENPSYTFDFYTKKVASMWTESTYSAIQNNIRSDNDYIKKPFAFLRSVCDERVFSFYLVDLLKEYCFIE